MEDHAEVDKQMYPEPKLLEQYMDCQSKAMSMGSLSFVTGGAAGFIATQLLPKIYGHYPKKYNILVIAGSGIFVSYFVSSMLTRQCKRQFLIKPPLQITMSVSDKEQRTQTKKSVETLDDGPVLRKT